MLRKYNVIVLVLLLAGLPLLTTGCNKNAEANINNKNTNMKHLEPLQVIEAKLEQGGFLIATTPKDSKIFYNEKEIITDKNGVFFIGFTYNSPKEKIIEIKEANKTKKIKISIKKKEWNIQKINGLKKKYVEPDPKEVEIISNDAKKIRKSREQSLDQYLAKYGYVVPAEGKITGIFGSKRILNGVESNIHSGIDIANTMGTPIVSMTAGKVVHVNENSLLNGKLVIVDHGLYLFSIYAHMNEIVVKEGQIIKKGDKIGEIGSTGRSTGPHLHFGVYWHNAPINPALFFDIKELKK